LFVLGDAPLMIRVAADSVGVADLLGMVGSLDEAGVCVRGVTGTGVAGLGL
jgi:hypothetical protein